MMWFLERRNDLQSPISLRRSVVVNKLPQFSLEPIPFALTLCLRSRIGMYFSAINDRVTVKSFSANFGMWYNRRLLIGHLRGPAPRSVFLTSISDRLTLSAEKNAFLDARGGPGFIYDPGRRVSEFLIQLLRADVGPPIPLCWHPQPGEA